MLHVVVTVVAVAAMVLATAVWDGEARIAGLAGAYSVAYAVGALGLGVALSWRHHVGRLADVGVLGRGVVAGLLAAGAMALTRLLDVGGARLDAAVQVAVGGALGLGLYLVAMRLLGLGDPRRLLHPEAATHA